MEPQRKKQRVSEDARIAAHVLNQAEALNAPPNATRSAASDPVSSEDTKNRRTLFVRSLATTTTTESLTEHFSASFPIKHAVAVTDKETKQCKGYGFVTFADAEDAQRAKEDFSNTLLQGRKIKVEIAEPRHRDPETGAITESAGVKFRAAQAEKTEVQPPPKLIVRNLPWSIKEPEQLEHLFRSYGKIKQIILPKKKGILAGFGIVIVRGRKNAEKALKGVNGKEVDGRTLAVDWAVDRETWEKTKQEEQHEDEGVADLEQQPDEDKLIDNGDDINADDDLDMDDDDDEELEDESEDEDAADEEEKRRLSNNNKTLFVRNVPFTCSDEILQEHFSQFGDVRYARIVLDHNTERPRGTGFVCFYKEEDCIACLKQAPKAKRPQSSSKGLKDSAAAGGQSILQDEYSDPSGQYTLDGRVLQISRAVNKDEAAKLTEEGVQKRYSRDNDKRRLYLLAEGTIPNNSPLFEKLTPSEKAIREASEKQRKTLIQSNPSLHLSLTRLSIRNIPRNITSKDLKALAREAVVGFAKDVREGKRQPLSKEEKYRGGEQMKEAEHDRKLKKQGVVKQAKVVFEGREGNKISEEAGAGRSRGYGFVEYYTHRNALMGLRWLNGHAVDYVAKESGQKKKMVVEKVEAAERRKRLIVEFAIENAQVVQRRDEREKQVRERPKGVGKGAKGGVEEEKEKTVAGKKVNGKKDVLDRKRKRTLSEVGKKVEEEEKEEEGEGGANDRLAKRQRIISKKRMARRTRKKGEKA